MAVPAAGTYRVSLLDLAGRVVWAKELNIKRNLDLGSLVDCPAVRIVRIDGKSCEATFRVLRAR